MSYLSQSCMLQYLNSTCMEIDREQRENNSIPNKNLINFSFVWSKIQAVVSSKLWFRNLLVFLPQGISNVMKFSCIWWNACWQIASPGTLNESSGKALSSVLGEKGSNMTTENVSTSVFPVEDAS
ncbi:hypothetical protein T07_5192 [Trichinella nelsoni]|uniref:Uncharacterized protein n=1 Tax=Trichinella nelsoni TaxID=6336 RepID=A0A0V0RQW2_9BILA|nr:hypothetical protein T07_997 [Trichinella nelsoni]KRX16850.1 hypothetical protein T07_5192 [Trichinella nelsoni]